MVNCIFCKIASGEVPSRKVYADDEVFAFHDINPQAPVHVLVIPKRHLSTLDDAREEDRPLLGHLLERVAHVARQLGLDEAGYRVLVNVKGYGGQEVFHIHVHLFGGKPLGPMLAR